MSQGAEKAINSHKEEHSDITLTVLSQYADISLRSGVFFFILKCTTDPSCPVTFRLMCSSVYD